MSVIRTCPELRNSGTVSIRIVVINYSAGQGRPLQCAPVNYHRNQLVRAASANIVGTPAGPVGSKAPLSSDFM